MSVWAAGDLRPAAVEERLPQAKDDKVGAKLLLAGLANLADTFAGNTQLIGNVREQGILQVIATQGQRLVHRRGVA